MYVPTHPCVRMCRTSAWVQPHRCGSYHYFGHDRGKQPAAVAFAHACATSMRAPVPQAGGVCGIHVTPACKGIALACESIAAVCINGIRCCLGIFFPALASISVSRRRTDRCEKALHGVHTGVKWSHRCAHWCAHWCEKALHGVYTGVKWFTPVCTPACALVCTPV